MVRQQELCSMRLCTLVLVRHGHVYDNDCAAGSRLLGWTDPPLSLRGRQQAERVARHLATEPPSAALYASPLRRAWTTAGAIGAALGLRPRRRVALREIACGSLDGLPLAEVQTRHPILWRRNLAQADDEFAWPGGESYRGFRERIIRGVTSLAEEHLGERIVLVTHAGVISQLLGALYGESAARWSAFRVGNASVTELNWYGGGGGLVRYDVRAA